MKPGRLSRRTGQGPGCALKRRQAPAGVILHVALESAAGADAGTEGGSRTKTKASLSVPILLAEIGQDIVLGQVRLDALLERLEAHEDDARVGSVREGGAVETDERHGMLTRRPSP